MALEITEVGVEFDTAEGLIASKIASLPTLTREYLKKAACVGTTFDDRLIAHLIRDPSIPHFSLAAKKRLLHFDTASSSWKFAHDLIHGVAYNLIPETQRDTAHYNVGRELWRKLDLEELDRYIFVVVEQRAAN